MRRPPKMVAAGQVNNGFTGPTNPETNIRRPETEGGREESAEQGSGDRVERGDGTERDRRRGRGEGHGAAADGNGH